MSDLEKKVAELEARCFYLGVVASAIISAIPDKEALANAIAAEWRLNDANLLYATSLSDSQRIAVQTALDALLAALSPKPDSPG